MNNELKPTFTVEVRANFLPILKNAKISAGMLNAKSSPSKTFFDFPQSQRDHGGTPVRTEGPLPALFQLAQKFLGPLRRQDVMRLHRRVTAFVRR